MANIAFQLRRYVGATTALSRFKGENSGVNLSVFCAYADKFRSKHRAQAD